MDADSPSHVPQDLPDRVDRALAALWRNDSTEFDGLLGEVSAAGTSIGRKLQAALAQAGPARPMNPTDLAVAGYRVIRELGRGGMGVVFEAEQVRTHRLVALKVIRELHALDDHHRRLFSREVRTLARLKHPHIAAVYDAGTTEAGHPYFAMELVRGRTLTEFVQAGPDGGGPVALRDRLRLFQRVCLAVSYAHQRGVIHRDLKPSNVLVTGGEANDSTFSDRLTAEVKVLDFGLARLVDDDTAPVSITVETGRIRGTLAYTSPEQARGDTDHVDTRSDVYSLGVMLYQLICGSMPHDLRGIPLPAAIQRICEQAPAPLTIPAAQDSKSPRARRSSVPGELRTIVHKALEKEPERRYQSAAALSDDIERFLLRQPILAQPPGWMYVVRKFIARHRVASALAAAILLLLVAFAGYASVGAARLASERDKALAAERLAEERLAEAEVARDEARTAAGEANAVSQFLQDMLASADPKRRGRDVRVTDLLDQAAASLETAASSVDPQMAGALHLTLGRTYRILGLFDRAQVQIDQAIAYYERELGHEAPRTLEARNERGVLLQDTGDPVAAEAVFREVLIAQERTLPRHDPAVITTRNNIALMLQERGFYAEALTLFQEVLDARTLALGENHKDTLEAANNLAGVLIHQGRWQEAEPLCLRVLEQQRRVLGDEHPDTLVSANDLALLLKRQGKLKESEALFREALAGLRKNLGDEHLDVLITALNLASVLRELGELDEAAELSRGSVEIAKRTLPPDSWYTVSFRGGYGRTLLIQSQYEAAEPELLAWYNGIRATFGDDHPHIPLALRSLIELYKRQARAEDAEHYQHLLLRAEKSKPQE